MLHLVGLVPGEAPEMATHLLPLEVPGGTLLIDDLGFVDDPATALTKEHLAGIWAELCDLSETSVVIALRFGQVVPDRAAAETVATVLLERLAPLQSDAADWRVSVTLHDQGSASGGAAFLAARKARADAERLLPASVAQKLGEIPAIQIVEPAVLVSRRVEARLRLRAADRSEVFAALERLGRDEGWTLSLRGPEPLLGATGLEEAASND